MMVKPDPLPSIRRIVEYHVATDDPYAGKSKQAVLPAIVVGVHPDGVVDLQVFPNAAQQMLYRPAVPFGVGPGCWNWGTSGVTSAASSEPAPEPASKPPARKSW